MAQQDGATRRMHALEHAVDARVLIPGSKSLTNRHLVLAALAEGRSTLQGILASDDCDRLRVALSQLGAVFRREGDSWIVDGVGGKPRGGGTIDLGHGGTPTRFMLAVASLCSEETVVDGSARMRERPVDEGVEMLVELGAKARFFRIAGALPVGMRGPLTGRRIEVHRTASSQFVSALMLIAPAMPNGLEIRFHEPPTSASYLELSIDALRATGVTVGVTRHGVEQRELASITIPPQAIPAHAALVEPDASSAVYFAALAALVGGQIEIPQLELDGRQPDLFFFRDLAARGAEVQALQAGAGGVLIRAPQGARLRGVDSDYSSAPDAAVMAMVLASCADAPSLLTGLETLRVKESDRIASVAAGLRALGGKVDVGPDWVRVHPLPMQCTEAVVQTSQDHRIAMAFGILGCARDGVSVADPMVVEKSWPAFWDALGAATGVR